MTQATKRPWRVGDAGLTVFGPPNGKPAPEVIATVRKREHAALIVHAVNCHDEARAALQALLFNVEHGNGLAAWDQSKDKARAVLAKMEGGK